ncbi:MAG: OmpA family protein [Kofleriaceae bacterium]
MRLRTTVFLAATAVAAAGVAHPGRARADVEIGATAGAHVFNKDNALGVDDADTVDSQRNAALFGVRLGVLFHRYFGVEGEVAFAPTGPSGGGQSTLWNLTYRAHVIAQLRATAPDHRLIPFVVAGGGAFHLFDTGGAPGFFKDIEPTVYGGLGAKYLAAPGGLGVRLDVRLLLPTSKGGGLTEDYEAMVSFYKDFGRPAPKPVVDNDPDKDGIFGAADKCPNDAEDKDGFQDEDGCPDLDNDGDGIPDAVDKCPNEAEDKDGFQDDDGCPDLDNDGDGIPDAVDKCPNEPEDKDGYQDDDGCPDPDNDGDGIPDAADKCPNEPETKNGFQDDDGCPDEIPARLKQFTGVIQGINFKVNDAALQSNSSITLDKAVAVLKEFADLKMEIQGHTDDQPLRNGRKYADNQALSQARAESVRAYMVAKGIDAARLTAKGYGDSVPVESPTGLKAGKLAAARAKNRRVEFKLISALTQ